MKRKRKRRNLRGGKIPARRLKQLSQTNYSRKQREFTSADRVVLMEFLRLGVRDG